MTDTINVPRELLERIIANCPLGSDYKKVWDLLQAPAQPAQVQGWQMVLPKRIYGNPYSRGFNACLDEVARLNAAAQEGK